MLFPSCFFLWLPAFFHLSFSFCFSQHLVLLNQNHFCSWLQLSLNTDKSWSRIYTPNCNLTVSTQIFWDKLIGNKSKTESYFQNCFVHLHYQSQLMEYPQIHRAQTRNFNYFQLQSLTYSLESFLDLSSLQILPLSHLKQCHCLLNAPLASIIFSWSVLCITSIIISKYNFLNQKSDHPPQIQSLQKSSMAWHCLLSIHLQSYPPSTHLYWVLVNILTTRSSGKKGLICSVYHFPVV